MTSARQTTRPEVMSPAGHWPELTAAVEAGADAVYFGLRHFTARAKVGFTVDELPDVMSTLHKRGVRGYVTFNTLIFDHELNAAAHALAAIAEAGADAIIVQDPAVGRLATRIAPQLELHGSTQMSVTSVEGVALAMTWGMQRLVLARELSLEEIRRIAARTHCELEMFVHGALCVSYSGQCFSSEAWGGRSANRGQCAQACRLPYDLFVDDTPESLGDARYLLSPGDLYALQQIPEIIDIGLSALKIEGRYKGPAYVALTTRAYRQAVDDAWDRRPLQIEPLEQLHLQQVYSRGLEPHFLTGTNHQTVVDGRAPGHRGVRVGTVVQVHPDCIAVRPNDTGKTAPLKTGDGLVFDAGGRHAADLQEEGGRIFRIETSGRDLLLTFGRDALNMHRIAAGDWVWRTHDPDVDRAARPFTQAQTPVSRLPVSARVRARIGAPLEIDWFLCARPAVTVTTCSTQPLERAHKHAPTVGFLRQQLGRLGGSSFELRDVELAMEHDPFVPASLLAPLRREAVQALSALLQQVPPRAGEAPDTALQQALAGVEPSAAGPSTEVSLHLLVRSGEQLATALELRPASITLDYLDLYGLTPAVEQVRSAGIPVRVASPRVLKPGEEGITRFLVRLGCPLLIRSGGLLQSLRCETLGTPVPLTGDFSLNAANVLTADALLRLGLDRITPTHDLNGAQITALATAVGARHLEVTAYH
ncbi:MAG: U32 family peptidase, partial [Gemmatimonadetes bacterium]|nr:U32 family peptidase [Gemmatimonadota bacterium]